MPEFKDLTGQRFGKLVVIKRAEDYVSPKGYVSTNWLCRCDCGKETVVRRCNLISGGSRSCGCERVIHPNRLTHGGTGTRLHSIWSGMRTRCNNPNDANYLLYGARGITICDEWNDFTVFRDWAYSHGYDDELTIDRIDCNGNYEPDNCRWVDIVTQANNTRSNHMIEYEGESHTMAEWSRIMNIPYHRLKDRINKCGWDVERALTT